jgi:DNA-binding transcriptional regulator WhiA
MDDVGEGALLDGESTPEQIDVGMDVREVIARLPDDLRQVALLRQKHSEKELEGLLDLTRAQVRGRLQRLERIFREAGLAPDSDE